MAPVRFGPARRRHCPSGTHGKAPPSSPGGFDRAKTPLLLHTVAQKGGQRRHKERALDLIKKSVHQALQDPARRQALQAEGIALRTNDLDEQGRLVERDRKLTPLLEAAANKALTHLAGLSDADMSRLDRAVFMAAIIREQLGQVMAVDEQGRPLYAVAADPLDRGESAALQVPRRLAQPKNSHPTQAAVAEGGRLTSLAAAYADEVLELDTKDAERLRQRATGTGVSSVMRTQLRLRDISDQQTPLAVALVHKLFPPAWVAQRSATKDAEGKLKTSDCTPTKHRLALINALQKLPEGVMDRLLAAAASPDPDAMAQECKNIEDAMAAPGLKFKAGDTHFPMYLHHALMRLQGYDYEPADTAARARLRNNAPDARNPPAPTYAGAPPADEALRWLRSKAPASAQCGGLP
jgi:hypothetical protein